MKTRKLTNDLAYDVDKRAYFDYDYQTNWIGTTTTKSIVENYGVKKEDLKMYQNELKKKVDEWVQTMKLIGVSDSKTRVFDVHVPSPRWRLGFILEARVCIWSRQDFEDEYFDNEILAKAI